MPDKQFTRSTSEVPSSARSNRFGQAPVADVYGDLRFGPQYDRTFSAQEGVPVDGSNQLLRQLSPFTISILPPLALSNVPEQQSTWEKLEKKLERLALVAESVFGQFLDKIAVPQVGPVVEDTGALENSDLTTHFTFSDFLKGHKVPPEQDENVILANIRLCAGELEKAKVVFEAIAGAPVTITIVSGYRDPEYNKSIGAVSNGAHTRGQAADIFVSGFTPTDVVSVLNELMDSGVILQGGLGYYPDGDDLFTHYDVRGDRQRWRDKFIDEGTEIKTWEEAIRMLPPGPLPSELARLAEESGHTTFLQRRTVPAGPPPDIPLLDAASSVNSWQEAKDARDRATLRTLGSSISGEASNRVKAEKFIAGGLLQTNEHGAFEEPGLADRLVAVDIASQLDTILKVPPLTLLINPSSFSVQYTKIHQFSQRTRNGFIYQGWGEEQPTLSISGKIGAFVAGDSSGATGPQTTAPTGVQFASKRNSASYQNLMALLGFYKHAGYVYDTVYKSNAHHMVGALAIEYDQFVYVGHMNSFSWGYEEAETAHGKIGFEIEFKVSQMFDNHTPVESIPPLRSLTDSLSSPGNVSGGVPLIDTPEGTSISTFQGSSASGTAFEGASGAPRGGSETVPTGEDGWVGDFCVLDPSTGGVLCFQDSASAAAAAGRWAEGLENGYCVVTEQSVPEYTCVGSEAEALAVFGVEGGVPPSNPFCVADPDTGDIVNCYPTMEEAIAAQRSLAAGSLAVDSLYCVADPNTGSIYDCYETEEEAAAAFAQFAG